MYPPYATSAQICSILTLNFLGPCSLPMLCSMALGVVGVCLPRPMEGMGLLQFSDLFTVQPVPSQATGVVGTFNVLLYIILSTTVSLFRGYHIILQVSLSFFFILVYIFFCKYTLHVCYVFNVI